MKYFVVNGMPKTGKDTFVDMCLKKIGPRAKKISTIDFVKAIAARCGWDGTKTPKNRKFLSDLKDLLTEWNDIPFKKTCQEIKQHEFMLSRFDMENSGVVFIFSREPEDIDKYVQAYGAKTVLIKRYAVESEQQSNHADNEVLNYNYDYIIYNNGSLQELENEVIDFLDKFEIL